MVKKASLLALGMALLLAGLIRVSASAGGHHPRYLHARRDLRAAQLLVKVRDEDSVMRHLRNADYEIGKAIFELDSAAALDRKDIEDHPRIDTSLNRTRRFNKVMALLISARRDISEEEDNPNAIGWRNAAYRHIDEAMNVMRKAARDLGIRLEGY